MYKQTTQCRICGNRTLTPVLDLGDQFLTGVFPRAPDWKITHGPIRLVKCDGDAASCGLLQMEHSYDLGEMYGDNYGYRSGLNSSMVAHLQRKVARIESLIPLLTGDLIIDIGSNDSTTLRAYSGTGCDLVGIDPTGTKFQKYYPPHVTLIPDFFSSSLLKERFPGRKAKVVTSFSMFYDLEAPMEFMREVFDVLADDGVWVFEQSYMPTMLSANSFDTACHEHLEYYALKQIKWMADRVGLTIVDLEFNDVNGGSFSVTVAKTASGATESPAVARALEEEARLGLDALEPYRQFAQRVEQARAELVAFVRDANAAGQTVAAIGASTKGNVLLQYCGFDTSQLSSVGEVNPEKYGCFTPGTLLPIVPEADLLADPPDFLLVLPWHFKSYFCSAERYKGHTLVFPLPKLEIVHC